MGLRPLALGLSRFSREVLEGGFFFFFSVSKHWSSSEGLRWLSRFGARAGRGVVRAFCNWAVLDSFFL